LEVKRACIEGVHEFRSAGEELGAGIQEVGGVEERDDGGATLETMDTTDTMETPERRKPNPL
jgi:hypothetical protein